MTAKPFLSVKNLEVHYPVRVGGVIFGDYKPLRAVDNVTFSLREGEALGVVGESGCGKSTMCRTAMLLQRPTNGQIFWFDNDVTTLSDEDLRQQRKNIQLVSQDPQASLNPRMTIFEALKEPITSFFPEWPAEKVKLEIYNTMELVGLLANMASRYPHELSGGQCQRVNIARAIIVKPKILVLDEPVSALDVSMQAKIINLLKKLQSELKLSYLFVGHDLSVIRYLCDRILVMYLGNLVEIGSRDSLFTSPRHPYTRALINSIPAADPSTIAKKLVKDRIDTEMPSPLHPPSGCRFHTRCAHSTDKCKLETPSLEEVIDRNKVACHHWLYIGYF